jgi:ribulose bisphosphate carboxylase small subunit
MDRCRTELPELTDQDRGHQVRCWLYNGD